jgi:plasmid stabilization system protein ParE
MPGKLVFLPEARQDIADAYSWYEEQSLGLGSEFIRCLDAAILSVERHPMIYPIVHEDYRRALVRRFPYAIFYEINAGQIVIYSVFHCSQDPQKWHSRTPKPAK